MARECMECVEGQAIALGLCSHCLAGEPIEAVVGQIARLARELEAARERERAVRDEATGYLAEIAGMLADMHNGEECRFEGGEGCLACYAQGRIEDWYDLWVGAYWDRAKLQKNKTGRRQ